MTKEPPMTDIEAAVSYVLRYGGMCRDCADEDGVCPGSGLPCDSDAAKRAVRHVIEALDYGRKHGFLALSHDTPAPAACPTCGSIDPEVKRLAEIGLGMWGACRDTFHSLYVTPAPGGLTEEEAIAIKKASGASWR